MTQIDSPRRNRSSDGRSVLGQAVFWTQAADETDIRANGYYVTNLKTAVMRGQGAAVVAGEDFDGGQAAAKRGVGEVELRLDLVEKFAVDLRINDPPATMTAAR